MSVPLKELAVREIVHETSSSLLDQITAQPTPERKPQVREPSTDELLRNEIRDLKHAVLMLAREVGQMRSQQPTCPVCGRADCPHINDPYGHRQREYYTRGFDPMGY